VHVIRISTNNAQCTGTGLACGIRVGGGRKIGEISLNIGMNAIESGDVPTTYKIER